ncbi:hypothetical protein FHS96_005877 [Sphingomonas zeicaulis]|uniref:peptidase S14 n=1 Tax=Sphingomonas zeicaulis TaxID=1632740 RepID=UPI003D1F9B1F
MDGYSSLDVGLAARVPHVRLQGSVDETMLNSLLDQIARLDNLEDPVIVELMTLGGGADTGRRIALEIESTRRRLDRRLVFVGKTAVYSAGVTIMSAFPRADRFLTSDAVLLIHCRQMESTVKLSGPLRPSADRLRALLSEIDNGLRIEQVDFEALVRESDVTVEEVLERAPFNWYVPSAEASQRRLVAAVI